MMRKAPSKSIEDLLYSWYVASRRLGQLKALSAPGVIIRGALDILERTRDEAKKAGLGEDDLGAFSELNWAAIDGEDLSLRLRDECLAHMRYFQEHLKEDWLTIKTCEHHQGPQECGLLCPWFQEATEQQAERFANMQAMDTGKPLPLEGLDEWTSPLS